MKFSSLSLLLTVGSATAFAPSLSSSARLQQSQLNLFGGGSKKEGGEKKGPGMMDQLAMLKKAQEMAQKKNKLDQELAAMDFTGTSEDGKVTAKSKYIPSKNPMDPTPEYDIVAFEFDDEWYEAASPEDISTGVKEAVTDSMKTINKGVEEKYQALTGDLQETFGALGGGPAPPS